MSRAIPIETKRRKGTSNSTRARQQDEPEFPVIAAALIPTPPVTINTQDGKQLWYRVINQLMIAGLLFDSCFEFLEAYCKAFENMQAANKEVQEQGMILTDVGINGGISRQVNPAYRIYNDAFDQMYRIGLQMGFTPVSKTKINTGTVGKTSDKNSQKKIGVR